MIFRLRIFLAGALFLSFSLGAFGISQDLPRDLKVVNVFTGIPQVDDDNPNQTGGFGDVAVNVVMAAELKARHPKLKVRLLVTSFEDRFQPQVLTSNEIIKIMIPNLDPKKKRIPQLYKGVEVVFLDFDFAQLLKKSEKKNQKEIPKIPIDWLETLPTLIPPADLNLNFSHYVGGGVILRLGAPVAIAFEEQFGGKKWLKEYGVPNPQQGLLLTLSSGPETGGFVISRKPRDFSEDQTLLKKWLASREVKLKGPLGMAMAYTSEWQSTQIYIDAISEMELSDVPLVLFIKDFSELDLSGLPVNVKVIKGGGVPHDVMSAVISHSSIPPLVTGDVSLGLALSSVRPNRTFAYESPPWKNGNAATIKKILANKSKLNVRDLSAMFLHTQKLATLSRDQLRKKGRKLANIFEDAALQNRIYESLNSLKNRWDLLGNALKIYGELRDTQNADEIKNTLTACVRALTNQAK